MEKRRDPFGFQVFLTQHSPLFVEKDANSDFSNSHQPESRHLGWLFPAYNPNLLLYYQIFAL